MLESTLHEAVKLGRRYVGAEHILRALINNRDSRAGRVLAGPGADLEAARGFAAALAERQGPPAGLPAEWSEPKRPRRRRRTR